MITPMPFFWRQLFVWFNTSFTLGRIVILGDYIYQCHVLYGMGISFNTAYSYMFVSLKKRLYVCKLYITTVLFVCHLYLKYYLLNFKLFFCVSVIYVFHVCLYNLLWIMIEICMSELKHIMYTEGRQEKVFCTLCVCSLRSKMNCSIIMQHFQHV